MHVVSLQADLNKGTLRKHARMFKHRGEHGAKFPLLIKLDINPGSKPSLALCLPGILNKEL